MKFIQNLILEFRIRRNIRLIRKMMNDDLK